MEEIVFEDGSGLRGDDACVTSVRDAETGTWTAAEPGRTFYDAHGRPWPACDATAAVATLPDTAVAPPVGPDLTGPIVVIVLLVTLVTDRVRAR